MHRPIRGKAIAVYPVLWFPTIGLRVAEIGSLSKATPALGGQAQGLAGLRAAWLLPSLAEVVFASVLLWLLLGAGRKALLADGDTGWHIRTGEWVLDHRRFPTTDLYSFSRPGAEWFAWEWLSDVALALVHRSLGLAGVTLLAGILIASTAAALFGFLVWQRSNVVIAVVVMLGANSASTVHWLARPHLFTYLLFILSLWLLEADRRRRSGRIWLLVGMAALWTNLHGGFLVLLALVGAYLAGAVVARDWSQVRRYGCLLVATAAATLANPYGWRLHAHIGRYLASDFIRDRVEEFQSPRFRGESMLMFEALLVGGLLIAPRLWQSRRYATALVLVGLAHAALGSVRHVLLYVLAAAPVVAAELTAILESRRDEWSRALASLGPLGAPGRRPPWWPPLWALGAILPCALLPAGGGPRWQVDFPKEKFPLAALGTVEKLGLGRNIFTSDQWGDYLIYRYYPQVRVFLDGRSDFYGAEIGGQYLDALSGKHRWEEIFRRHAFDVALLPPEWPLATVLKRHPDWRLEYDDGQALVLRRVAPAELGSAN